MNIGKSYVAFLQGFLSINPSGRVNWGNFSFWYDGIIGSIPCGRIECIKASVPLALIVPFNSDLSIHLSLHMRFEVTASEPNKCYLSI